jgi:putative transposase
MARPRRVYVPGVPAHVVHRGVERRSVFFSDSDYARFLDLLGEGSRRYGAAVHAYVLMTNHVHILMTPESAGSISDLMRFLGGAYVPVLNKRLERSGHLWGSRHHSRLITDARYLLACYRYIELNPVRAGMTRHPGGYPWSSHRGNALGAPNTLITPHDEFLALSSTPEGRHRAYAGLFHPEMLASRPVREEAARFRQR